MLGVTFSDEVYREKAEETVAKFKEKRPDASFAIGECMNGDPFEMALAMIKYGFKVPEIYGTLTAENFIYLNQLSQPGDEGIFQYGTDHAVLRSGKERREYDHWKGCGILSSGSAECDLESGQTALWLCRCDTVV